MTGFDSGGPSGPLDDPSNRPTRMTDYGAVDSQPPGFDGYPDYSGPAEPESPPAPWYRNRSLLAVWAAMVAILVVLIIYGLIQISHGGGGGEPSTTEPSTTPTRSSTPSTTTEPSTTPPPPSPSSSPEEEPSNENSPPPAEAPPPEQPEPPHHHHLPHIPSTITLPHTVITLPHGW